MESVKAQVVIIGSGPGGISAAVAAARQGASVVLVERQGYLGGNLGSGLPFLAMLDHKQGG
jgi:flavin-dependent dehydrogenase